MRIEYLLAAFLSLFVASPSFSQPNSPACIGAKERASLLLKQQQEAMTALGSDVCSGPARSICLARLRSIGNDISTNARLIRKVCDPNYRPPSAPAPPPTPPPIPLPPDSVQYFLSLDRIVISKTRAKNNDTDSVTFGLQVGAQMYQPFVKQMGDLGDGLHTIGFRFGPINVKPDDPIAFTYIVVNSGFNGETGLEIANLLSDVSADVLSSYLPGLGAAANFVGHKLNGIFGANCDGVVVAEKIDQEWQLANSSIPFNGAPAPGQPISPLTGSDLWRLTARGPLSETHEYPGTNSNIGCGENSLYYVTFTISRVRP
jgi:hypothetical protein